MSKLLLQAVHGILAIRRLILAALAVLYGTASPVYQDALPALPALDSNLRFFGGVGLGLGLVMLWITPAIERRTALFRCVWICALLGGIGRAASLALVGRPPVPMLVFAVIEASLALVLIWWQSRVARAASAPAGE